MTEERKPWQPGDPPENAADDSDFWIPDDGGESLDRVIRINVALAINQIVEGMILNMEEDQPGVFRLWFLEDMETELPGLRDPEDDYGLSYEQNLAWADWLEGRAAALRKAAAKWGPE